MEAYQRVTESEADAYKQMKATLGFASDSALLGYIKVKAVNNFNQKNLVVGFKWV